IDVIAFVGRSPDTKPGGVYFPSDAEPTNHLSLVLATELESSIEQYPGAVVIASHDRWLRHRWQGRHHAMIFDVEH
ncbi:MAG: hypothetical protein ACTH1B_05510, partial [Yaniella sp.]|uniref:hypothetical protein n=1 Tax=Yaniella sp. TaxID=2773929 RepID=UPI003F95B1BD